MSMVKVGWSYTPGPPAGPFPKGVNVKMPKSRTELLPHDTGWASKFRVSMKNLQKDLCLE